MTITYGCVTIPSNHSKARNKILPPKSSKGKELVMNIELLVNSPIGEKNVDRNIDQTITGIWATEQIRNPQVKFTSMWPGPGFHWMYLNTECVYEISQIRPMNFHCLIFSSLWYLLCYFVVYGFRELLSNFFDLQTISQFCTYKPGLHILSLSLPWALTPMPFIKQTPNKHYLTPMWPWRYQCDVSPELHSAVWKELFKGVGA